MTDYRKLEVWKLSHQLTIEIYIITKEFPSEEKYGLISQMRRSAYSIPTNIAEGSGYNSDPQFLRFINIALGSSSELEYQLELAKDLGYISKENYLNLSKKADLIRRMIFKLSSKVNSRIRK